MARIRSVKPEFFKHEGLYDLEKSAGLPVRVAFAGLWTVCDRDGRFKWRPRSLKLDVLPHDEVDFGAVLTALESAGFIKSYMVAGEKYGHIPKWNEHQCPNVKEPKSTIPAPCEDSASTMTASGEGKGKEGNVATRVDTVQTSGQGVAHVIGQEHGISDRYSLLAIAGQISMEIQASGRDELIVADEVRAAIDAYKASDEFQGQYRKSWKTFFGDRDTWRKFVMKAPARKVITPSEAQAQQLARFQ